MSALAKFGGRVMRLAKILALEILALVLLCTAAAVPARAQDKYPSKPIKIIVPYVPGGATDIVARILADQLGKILGQTVVVENRPGAFGIIAIEDMVRSGADGYTLMIGNVSTNAITPIIYPQKFKIDYARDVTPITNVVDIPAMLVTTTKNSSPTRRRIPAKCATALSGPEAIRTTTWRISPSAPAIST
jgi:tripartite-type tricarboxylate transporter receptor subunit TctC